MPLDALLYLTVSREVAGLFLWNWAMEFWLRLDVGVEIYTEIIL